MAKGILIIAGPNGAGKTTFAREYLPREAGFPEFINADLLASALSPFDPDRAAFRAGRLMLAEIQRRVLERENFAFETTLAGKLYATRIPGWRSMGYRVMLVFLSLPAPRIAIARVKTRAASGGHSIPEDVIRRRFDAGLKNFNEVYRDLVDAWMLYDNSQLEPRLLAEGAKA